MQILAQMAEFQMEEYGANAAYQERFTMVLFVSQLRNAYLLEQKKFHMFSLLMMPLL